MSREIRNSAKALIIKDGKMLAIKIRDSDGDFYIMPGGGQEAKEQLSQTVWISYFCVNILMRLVILSCIVI